jgi:hypothetical protein
MRKSLAALAALCVSASAALAGGVPYPANINAMPSSGFTSNHFALGDTIQGIKDSGFATVPIGSGGTGQTTASAALAALAGAPLASPALTGTPTAPTATFGTSTTQIATTAFVQAAVGGGGIVSSVFGRTGAVVATSGDYSFSLISGTAAITQGGTGGTSASAARANLSVPGLTTTNEFTQNQTVDNLFCFNACSAAAGGQFSYNPASFAFGLFTTTSGGASHASELDVDKLVTTVPIAITSGGTGATSASAARTALGAAASGANGDITSLTGLTTALPISEGGTGGTNASGARTNLAVPGLATGNIFTAANTFQNNEVCFQLDCSTATGTTGFLQFDGTSLFTLRYITSSVSHLADLSLGNLSLNSPLPIADGGTGAITSSTARAALAAAASGANSDITSITGLTTPLTIAQGGCGQTSASACLAALAGAPLASPTFTGTPAAPTPATADNTTKIATTAYVKAQGYITSAPVTSVFGRTGVVVAASNDYTFAQLASTPTTVAGYGITNAVVTTNNGSDFSNVATVRTNLAVPGLATANVFTSDNTFQNNEICFQLVCGSPTGTTGFVQFDGTSLFTLRYAVSGVQHLAGLSLEALTLNTDLTVANGGTGASTASAARSSLGAAASGANSDITSLSGLTTALSIAQGGTAGTTPLAALANLDVENGVSVGDADVTIATTTTLSFTTIPGFSTPHTWTLPSLASVNSGHEVWIVDKQNTVTATNTLTIAPGGADVIRGGNPVMNEAAGSTHCVAAGGGFWVCRLLQSAATKRTSDFAPATSGTSILKGNGSGGFSSAVSNTDYLPPASPTMTGTPTAPTATGGTNTTQVATTAFVQTAVGGVSFPVTTVFGRTGTVVATSGDYSFSLISGTAAITQGGTGGTSASAARTNLAVPGLTSANEFTQNQTFDNLICFTVCSAAAGGQISYNPASFTFSLFTTTSGGVAHASTLDVDTLVTTNAIAIANGGTGAGTAAAALTNLGALGAANNLSDVANYITALSNLGQSNQYLATAFSATTTTLAPVTGFSFVAANSGAYHFKALLFFTGDATGGVKFRMQGTALAALYTAQFTLNCNSSGANITNTVETSMAASISYSGGCTSLTATIEGVAQITGTGTGSFVPQFAQATASGTSSVNVNSFVEYQKLN